MTWKLIAVPLIGAIIGYITNWIAVKMLFWPRREVRVFGRRLPFTPGVIPKGQGRLARAVGRAVEEQLLTREVLSEVLLSDAMRTKVREAVAAWVRTQEQSTETVREAAVQLTAEETVDTFVAEIEEQLTDVIYQKITEMNPGKLIADKVLETAKEKLEESMFGMMLGSSFLDPIARLVEERINTYMQEYGHDYVAQIVREESGKIQDKTLGELFVALREKQISLPDMVVSLYESMIVEKLPDMLETLGLSRIVEDRINRMEVAEVEKLLLSIMKKELGAVVNLGALIGFILGLINVAIIYI